MAVEISNVVLATGSCDGISTYRAQGAILTPLGAALRPLAARAQKAAGVMGGGTFGTWLVEVPEAEPWPRTPSDSILGGWTFDAPRQTIHVSPFDALLAGIGPELPAEPASGVLGGLAVTPTISDLVGLQCFPFRPQVTPYCEELRTLYGWTPEVRPYLQFVVSQFVDSIDLAEVSSGSFPTLNPGSFPTLNPGTPGTVQLDEVPIPPGGSKVTSETLAGTVAPSLNADGVLPSLNADGVFPAYSATLSCFVELYRWSFAVLAIPVPEQRRTTVYVGP